jgi:ABC-type transport system involved in multi-copper enzyme maturation permease subunit
MSSTVKSEVLPRSGLVSWVPKSDLGRVLLECLAILLLLGEVVGLLWFGSDLAPGLRVLLWGQWVALAGVVGGFLAVSLVGPVFFYDLVRLTRRGRYFLIRVVYALGLLLLIYIIWSNDLALRGGNMSPAQLAQFANQFFFAFVGVQLGMVLLLTPAYTAGAIAEEKDRKTLEFILATDLRDREIVLGKLAARLLNLLFVVLVGMPILAIMQILGGVDPGLLAAGFAATILTMVSLAAISVLVSALVRRPRDAIVLAYLALPAYLVVALSSYLVLLPKGWDTFPSTATWQSPVTLADVVEWINAGNLFRALQRVVLAYGSPTLPDVLLTVLGRYTLFHGLATLLCCALAVHRMRQVALRDVIIRQRKKGGPMPWRLPPVGRRPMLWKELHADRGVRLHWLGRLFIVVLVAASFLPLLPITSESIQGVADSYVAVASFMLLAVVIAAALLINRGSRFSRLFGGVIALLVVVAAIGYLPLWLIILASEPVEWDRFGGEMNTWVRGVGTAVACLMLLGVAVRAAGGVSGERERQTFDSLLTSPLESREILFAKWLSSILSMRGIWMWLGAIWLLGVLSGGLSLLAVPLLVASWFVYAAFVATVGLWYSTVCPTSLRATLWTLFTLVVVWLSHWLIWMCCIPFFISAGPANRALEHILPRVFEFQAFALTPPATLGFLAFRLNDFEHLRRSGDHINWGLEFLMCSFVGLGGWTAAALILWSALVDRFNQVTSRLILRGPLPARAVRIP